MAQVNIVMIGATGHLQSVMDSALSMGAYHIAAICDDDAPKGKEYLGYYVTGSTAMLPKLFAEGIIHAFVSAGSIGEFSKREELYERSKEIGFHMVNIIDPTAAIARKARVGENVFVGKNAVINSYAEIGNMAIVNTASVVEHSDLIEDYVHIAPGCTLCGGVHICRGAHIGAGSTVREKVTIGREALIGIGSVVVTDIGPGMLAYGNPCRERSRLN